MKRFAMLMLAVTLVPALEAASVSGTVHDPSGAVIPEASVELIGPSTGAKQKAATSPAGQFSFAGLPGGVYRLEIAKAGFVRYTRDLRVDAQGDARLPVLLKVGQIMESLEITAEGSPVPRPVKVRVGGAVQPPRPIHLTKLPYPEAARAAGSDGPVIVHAVVMRDGSIGSATAFPGSDPELAQAAVDAVRQWKYAPALLNGEPIETAITVEARFRLER
jgi:TonB family protein